jgi:CMP/dCMP kinase
LSGWVTPSWPADDAVVVDSTDLTRAAVVERIVELARTAVTAGEQA